MAARRAPPHHMSNLALPPAHEKIDSSSNGNVNEWGDPVDSGGGDGGGSGWDDLFSAAQDVFFDDDE